MNKKKLSHVDWLCILIYPKKEEKKIIFSCLI
jgi:predicted AlkP superfamily phosphohydrolase/phosphomutase